MLREHVRPGTAAVVVLVGVSSYMDLRRPEAAYIPVLAQLPVVVATPAATPPPTPASNAALTGRRCLEPVAHLSMSHDGVASICDARDCVPLTEPRRLMDHLSFEGAQDSRDAVQFQFTPPVFIVARNSHGARIGRLALVADTRPLDGVEILRLNASSAAVMSLVLDGSPAGYNVGVVTAAGPNRLEFESHLFVPRCTAPRD